MVLPALLLLIKAAGGGAMAMHGPCHGHGPCMVRSGPVHDP